MTLYEFLMLLHVVAAIVWVGAATTFFALEFRTDLSGDRNREAIYTEDGDWLAPRLFIPSALSTLIFGVLAAIEGSWDFGSLWIIIGLTGFAVSFAVGIGYFEPEGKKLAAAIEREGAEAPEVRRRLANFKMVGRIELAVLYVVVASMVVKPTGDDGGTLAIFALLLVLAAGAAVAWHRRMSSQTPADL